MTSAIEQLYARGKWGQGLSLHRNRWLYDHLPYTDWLAQQNAIKVTGSNGKGSVALYTSAILNKIGYRTGCYTSPHLFDISERVLVGGTPVGHDRLNAALEHVFPLVADYEDTNPKDTFGTFEILTAAALVAFQEANCNALVIEAGVGGRLDVTRLIPGRIAALTSIDLEHQAILGPTKEHILYDKADLCPPDGTLVCGLLADDLEKRLESYARLTGASPSFVRSEAPFQITHTGPDGFQVDFRIDGLHLDDVAVRALGRHQVVNATQAMLTAKHWLDNTGWDWDADAFSDACRAALADTRPALRLEAVSNTPTIIADVCHSPDAAQKAMQAIHDHFPDEDVILVTGASSNKDASGILEALAPSAAQIICTRAEMMGRPAHDLANHLPADLAADIIIEDDLAAALNSARQMASDTGTIVLIAGGLFLAAEAVAILRGQKRELLRFL